MPKADRSFWLNVFKEGDRLFTGQVWNNRQDAEEAARQSDGPSFKLQYRLKVIPRPELGVRRYEELLTFVQYHQCYAAPQLPQATQEPQDRRIAAAPVPSHPKRMICRS